MPPRNGKTPAKRRPAPALVNPRAPTDMNLRQFPDSFGIRPKSPPRSTQAENAAAYPGSDPCGSVAFPHTPPPCDFQEHRDVEAPIQQNTVPLTIEVIAGPPPRFEPIQIQPASAGADPFLLAVPVEVPIESGFIGYSARFQTTLNEPAWAGIIRSALYVDDDRIMPTTWRGQLQAPVEVPLLGRAKEGSVVRLGVAFDPAGLALAVPRDFITVSAWMQVTSYYQTTFVSKSCSTCDCDCEHRK